MATVVITGANRGIGLELCRQMAARGDRVIAACRTPSDALIALGVKVEDGVEVTSDAAVASLAERLGDTRVDILINNAGILERDSLEALDAAGILRQFEANALGPLRLTRALLSNLHMGSKVIMITSRMGSIGDNTSGGMYGYRMSKAALNMAAVSLAQDLRDRAIAVGILHPGWVKTDMTNGQGPTLVHDSVKGLLARIDELDLASSGSFRHAQGEELPW